MSTGISDLHQKKSISDQYQKKIEDAYLQLLAESGRGDTITVRAICQRAKINRSTFYAHYLDVFDLREKLVQKTAANFSGIVRDFFREDDHLGDPAHDRTDEISCRILGVTGDYQAVLSDDSLRNDVVSVIAAEDTAWCIERYRKAHAVVPRKVELEYKMMISGAVRLWIDWIGDGCKDSPELISAVVKEYVLAIIYRMWKIREPE